MPSSCKWLSTPITWGHAGGSLREVWGLSQAVHAVYLTVPPCSYYSIVCAITRRIFPAVGTKQPFGHFFFAHPTPLASPWRSAKRHNLAAPLDELSFKACLSRRSDDYCFALCCWMAARVPSNPLQLHSRTAITTMVAMTPISKLLLFFECGVTLEAASAAGSGGGISEYSWLYKSQTKNKKSRPIHFQRHTPYCSFVRSKIRGGLREPGLLKTKKNGFIQKVVNNA